MDECDKYYILIETDGIYSLKGPFEDIEAVEEWQDTAAKGWSVSPLEIEMLKR